MARSKKTKPAADPNAKPETKRERFVRLGAARMSAALQKVRLLGNLSSANYEYTELDCEKMRSALVDAVTETMKKFQPRDPNAKKEDNAFTF